MKRVKMAQDRFSGENPPGLRVGGWGGRRHGLNAKGKSPTITVVLTVLESRLLERLRLRLLSSLGKGDSSLSLKGKWSQGEVIRYALRQLAKQEGIEFEGVLVDGQMQYQLYESGQAVGEKVEEEPVAVAGEE